MEKFVIEDALYLFESIKENKMISYDDNLINSSNNKINNDKLNYIDKNIKISQICLIKEKKNLSVVLIKELLNYQNLLVILMNKELF